MTVSHTPAPARSDIAPAPSPGAGRPYLVHGRVLTVGALSWAATMSIYGLNPADPVALAAQGLGAGLFQLGLLALLRVLWRTRALGEGRIARGVLRVEAVVVTLAIASTLVDAVGISDLSRPGWALLDACWPLSMVGMFLIGIRIAIAGRWHGASRFWPMVAESWAVVVIPVLALFGEAVASVVAPLHLVVGYAVLGFLVSHKQD